MRAYERFVKYIEIDTQSREDCNTHPSYEGEFALAKMLRDELINMKLSEVSLDDKCYLYAYLPATEGYENIDAIGFIAHMDTSPDASGANVRAVFHENYDGGDIVYPASGKIMKASDFPELKSYLGQTLITSDGTTLLGSDDKAGIAEIMTAIEEIIANDTAHGPIYVAFTPDEEIGEGADFFNLDIFAAKYAYTVDGGDVDTIEYENFNAASAKVIIKGLSVHPGDAKDKMINASNVAMQFHMLLPVQERPEHTQGYEGFYHLTDMSGCCEMAQLSYIIRDHDAEIFAQRKECILNAAKIINEKYGEGTVCIDLKDSYYNMKEKILPHIEIVEMAKEAISMAGYTPREIPIRGGTDGARLSFMGLPCPNLGTGGCNFHGPFECNSIEKMDAVVDIISNIIKLTTTK